jgi:hypothetical protein
MRIERSAGFPLEAGAVTYGMAGGDWSGVTAELDAVVLQAAEALAAAYGRDIEVRFNSDRHSGGAFLRTPAGRNDEVGIGASVITAWTRERWESRVQPASSVSSARSSAKVLKNLPPRCAGRWRTTPRGG